MKFFKKTILLITVLSSCSVWAGNEDRAGSAGATDLLINPWARSSAWGSAGLSSVNVLEVVFLNVVLPMLIRSSSILQNEPMGISGTD